MAKSRSSVRERRGPARGQGRHGRRVAITYKIASEGTQRRQAKSVRAFAQDIGSGGAFIVTETPAPLDTQLEVTFALPGKRRRVGVRGQVRWVANEPEGVRGMGVQFFGLDLRETAAIDASFTKVARAKR